MQYTLDPYGYARRLTQAVSVGPLMIGATNPVRIQGRVKLKPLEFEAVVQEICAYANSGCELVAVPVREENLSGTYARLPAELTSRGYKVPLVAETGTNLKIARVAAGWADMVTIEAVASNSPDPHADNAAGRKDFIQLVEYLKGQGKSLHIRAIQEKDNPELKLESVIEQALYLPKLAFQNDFHDLLLSIEAYPLVQAYRLLSAFLYNLDLPNPLYLEIPGVANSGLRLVEIAAGIGSLLEDGMGDVLMVTTGESPQREAELALRLARRYTPVSEKLLDQAGLEYREPPVVVAASRANINKHIQATTRSRDFITRLYQEFYIREIDQYPYVVSVQIDRRNPYRFYRQKSREIQVGKIKIGGNNPIPNMSSLTTDCIKHLANKHKNQEAGALPLVEPAIYLAKVKQFYQVQHLKKEGSLTVPVVIATQKFKEIETLLEQGADGLLFCIDTGEINCEMTNLRQFLKVLKNSDVPLFLTSTSNVGQSWGSYDYWAQFAEARQLVMALELCQKYRVKNVIAGIYTYNPAWNIQNVRLFYSKMSERGWDYPVHLIAPDILDNDEKTESVIDAAISLGSLLVDGIGDLIQTDLYKSIVWDYPPGFTETGQLNLEENVALAHNLVEAANRLTGKRELTRNN